MFIDFPPEPFARFVGTATAPVEAWVDGNYCGTSEETAPGWYRIDVQSDCGYDGATVVFTDADGNPVATLAWENWHLTRMDMP